VQILPARWDPPQPGTRLRGTSRAGVYRVPVPTPARPLSRHLAAASGAIAVGVWLLVAGPASAAPTCVFDQVGGAVTITVGGGETAVIAVANDAITLNGTACDAATVSTTDSITVNATGTPLQVDIDLGGGEFGPGLTPEGDGSSEIEFTLNLPSGSPILRVVGGANADNLVYGTGGINLNGAESTADADVTINGTPRVVFDGNGGDDVLSVGGGTGSGEPASGTLNGGGENDLLFGGLGGSTFDGGDGTDGLDYAAATQLVVANLATGVANHAGGLSDELSNLENLAGSPGADAITGDDGPNVLQAGGGDDLVIGGGGDDTLGGGEGLDTFAFGIVEDGVQVDLRDGTSEGEGNDVLADFENVVGTPQADTIHADHGRSIVIGGRGSDELFGHDGADALRGDQGNDQLFGQKGTDLVSGGPGRDQLDGGQAQDRCRGGPDPDAFVFCEVTRLN
jgi:RTX calcium-binding nonapeptide repeat (4 copies)